MDPVSQTQASEILAARGYSIIGWYHSHPAFDPNPSLRDIDTQAKYQVITPCWIKGIEFITVGNNAVYGYQQWKL